MVEEKTLDVAAQNEDAAARAPVVGVSGGSSAPVMEDNLFIRGFDSAEKW